MLPKQTTGHYVLSSSPHTHAKIGVSALMLDVIIALLPAIVVSVVFYGWSELLVLAVGAVSCVLLEYVIARWMMKDMRLFSGSSALVTGLLLSMNLPLITSFFIFLSDVSRSCQLQNKSSLHPELSLRLFP